MERFKSCPRCQGNLFVGWDYADGGWFESCLQCSFRSYLPALAKAHEAGTTVGKGKRGKAGRVSRNRRRVKASEAAAMAPGFQGLVG